MSKPVVATIVVVFVLGLSGGCVVGWLFFTKDRVALLSYRVGKVEGMSMEAVVVGEENLLESEAVLEKVIANLDLVDEWGMDSKQEAIAHMQEKLIVKEERIGSRIRVLYRDRKQERAYAILKEIKSVYPPFRAEAVEKMKLPPLLPAGGDVAGDSSNLDSLQANP